jgi:hypothetical protein
MPNPKIARVLSIDGGGIRGLIPALLLSAWEAKLASPIRDHFHLLAGSSTGGILACGLSRPGQPLAAAELVSFYRAYGPKIFRRSLLRAVTTLGGAAEERFPAAPLEEALQQTLSGTLRDVVGAELLVSAYDIENRCPFFFKSWKARGVDLGAGEHGPELDYRLIDVARATAAAPTYFEPAKVANALGDTRSLVDGGVFANNPAMCAYASARKLYPNADKYLIVSLGTGQLERRIPHEDARDWGLLQWARPLLNVVFDGVSDTVDYQLNQLAPHVAHYRFQISLGSDPNDPNSANDDLDDASPSNMARLARVADNLMQREASRMDALLDQLKAPRTPEAELSSAVV